MQGRVEKQRMVEARLKEKLIALPPVYLRYYYSMATKSYTTKYSYTLAALRFVRHTFGEYVGEEQLSAINAYTVQTFLEQVKYIKNGREMSGNTQQSLLASVSAFCKFLWRTGILTENPVKTLDSPKRHTNDVIYLTPAEITAIEDNILHGVGSPRAIERAEKWRERNMLLFRLPLICGVRVGAMSEVNLEDIDFNDGCIYVTEKENKNRKFFLDDGTMKYIRRYTVFRNMVSNDDERAFFVSDRGTRISVRAIQFIIKRYSEDVNDKITPHKLRATYATLLYQQTRDIYKVSKALGHESTVPTQRYVHYENVNDAENAEIMAEFLRKV